MHPVEGNGSLSGFAAHDHWALAQLGIFFLDAALSQPLSLSSLVFRQC